MAVRILVVGSVNMDLLLLTPRLPLPGETLVSEEYRFGPGGKGANQAVACAMMGGDTTFAGKTGADDFGTMLRQSLTDKGINTDFLTASERLPSGFAVILLEDGNNRIISHMAANLELSKEDIDRAFAREYDGMVINFELAEEIVIHACRKACERGIPIIMDAGPAIGFPLEKLPPPLIISPNETEAEVLTGISLSSCTGSDFGAACAEVAEALQKRSRAAHVVLKLGKRGAYHYRNKQGTHYPPHTVKAVDPTAAGDVFTAAMGVQYLTHGDMTRAIRYANIAGAITVTRAGAQESIPTAKEVEAFFK
ncbi:MAG: ribokinase [Defluviitaleaceae bacterium]|nr:ribokinase [Defluviitaleaceae bacterium]